MFGMFKKKMTPGEFGHAVPHNAMEFLASDAGRSLGMRFPNWDGSHGWTSFLVSRGVTIPTQQLYLRFYAHCAVQAACTDANEPLRRSITQGAIAGFIPGRVGYDFNTTYAALEAAYAGSFRFQPEIEQLTYIDAPLNYLPNPHVGGINAKFLMQAFVVNHLQNADAFFSDFQSYSSPMGASIGTVRRASNYVAKSFKIVAP